MSSRIKYLEALVLVVVASLASCRPASYELIRLDKPKKGKSQANPSPVPPDASTDKPTAPPPLDYNVPPTARIEVVWNGDSVVKVRVGDSVNVRPTWDTLDPDDIGRSACANPGIVRAAYEIESTKPVATRAAGCETLAVPYVFNTPGDYPLFMTVTSNENETAVASMILTVLPKDAPLTGPADAGFTIKAEPILAKTKQDVNFIGRCVTTKRYSITWNFADGGTAAGQTVKHSYAKTGQYPVKAVCQEEGGRKLDAQVTIVVIDKQVEIPGRPTWPGNDDGSEDGVADLSDNGNTDGTGHTDSDDGTDTTGGGKTDGGTGGNDDGGNGDDPSQGDPGQTGPQPIVPGDPGYDPGVDGAWWF